MSERKNDFIELTNEHGYKVLINQSQIASIQRTDYKNYSGVIFFANGEGRYVKETYEEIKAMIVGAKSYKCSACGSTGGALNDFCLQCGVRGSQVEVEP